VLYHLREVIDAAIVFVVEGEKDVETLREHGFVATTNARAVPRRHGCLSSPKRLPGAKSLSSPITISPAATGPPASLAL
jgi:hypothetical protein